MFLKLGFVVVFAFALGILQIQAMDRIIGGKQIDIKEAPFAVRLFQNDRFICGGTLIHPRYVVTATHCLIDSLNATYVVRGGGTKRVAKGEARKVVKFVVHSSYNKINKDKDVAVLKLNEPLEGNNVATMPLCEIPPPPGVFIKIIGWGKTMETSAAAKQLMAAQVKIVTKKLCQAKYGSVQITKSQFCAMDTGKDSCKGDSGGPAIYNNTLVGIVSWGIGCGRPGYPGVYTSVKEVLPFIKQAMKVLRQAK